LTKSTACAWIGIFAGGAFLVDADPDGLVADEDADEEVVDDDAEAVSDWYREMVRDATMEMYAKM
jgi:hypothetical protein